MQTCGRVTSLPYTATVGSQPASGKSGSLQGVFGIPWPLPAPALLGISNDKGYKCMSPSKWLEALLFFSLIFPNSSCTNCSL